MAVYAVTVALDQRSAAKFGNGGFKLLAGSANITNYNSTKPASSLVGEFRTLLRVVCDGVSSNGYLVRWDATATAFKAFYPTKAITPTGTVAAPVFTGAAASLTATSSAPTITATGTHGARTVFLTAGGAVASSDDATVTGITGVQAPTITCGAYTPAGTNSAPAFTGAAVAGQAGTEVANDVAIGSVNFLAFGV